MHIVSKAALCVSLVSLPAFAAGHGASWSHWRANTSNQKSSGPLPSEFSPYNAELETGDPRPYLAASGVMPSMAAVSTERQSFAAELETGDPRPYLNQAGPNAQATAQNGGYATGAAGQRTHPRRGWFHRHARGQQQQQATTNARQGAAGTAAAGAAAAGAAGTRGTNPRATARDQQSLHRDWALALSSLKLRFWEDRLSMLDNHAQNAQQATPLITPMQRDLAAAQGQYQQLQTTDAASNWSAPYRQLQKTFGSMQSYYAHRGGDIWAALGTTPTAVAH